MAPESNECFIETAVGVCRWRWNVIELVEDTFQKHQLRLSSIHGILVKSSLFLFANVPIAASKIHRETNYSN